MKLTWPVDPQYGISVVGGEVQGSDAHLARGEGLAMDWAVPVGRNVYFAGDAQGHVIFNGFDPVCGHRVWIQWRSPDDDLFRVRYCHGEADTALPINALVDPGEVVLLSGNSGRSTGPHLHAKVERYTGAWVEVRMEDYLEGTANLSDVPKSSTEETMQSIKDSLDKGWAILSAIQAHPEATDAIKQLAEDCKQQIVVEVKAAVGLA